MNYVYLFGSVCSEARGNIMDKRCGCSGVLPDEVEPAASLDCQVFSLGEAVSVSR